MKDLKCGSHFSIYYDEDYAEEADIELCLPIRHPDSKLMLAQRKLPSIKALSLTHAGSYENLCYAYKYLFDYAASLNLKLLAPSREVYIRAPGMLFRGNPDNYVTEILMPFSKQGSGHRHGLSTIGEENEKEC